MLEIWDVVAGVNRLEKINWGDQMKTENTTAAGQTGEAESLILSDIGKGAPVYRPNGDRIGRIESGVGTEATGKIVYAVPWSLLVYNPRLDGYELTITDTSLGA
jgi:hypothetical protein